MCNKMETWADKTPGVHRKEIQEGCLKQNAPLRWSYRRNWDIWIVMLVLCWSGRLIPGALANAGKSPLEYRIPEESPRDTIVGYVATDARLTEKYSSDVLNELRFRFLTQPDLDRSYFEIEEKTGIIRTTGRIDRDLICPHKLKCLLNFDVGLSPVQYFDIIKVVLEVLDINDNPPIFSQRELSFDISESTAPGTSFAIPAASDPDSAFNGIQEYELVSPSGKFDLRISNSADGSTNLRLVLKEPLDREIVNFYQVRVIAHDGGMPSKSGSVIIDIDVKDANDNNPQFDSPIYEVFVTENLPIGSVVTTVHARDADDGINGRIVYKFSKQTHEEFGKLFGIKGDTGEVFVKQGLNYEEGHIYQLSVMAHDQGPDGVPATASLVVRVQDINDNPPKIDVNTLTTTGEAQVQENAKVGTFVAHISVTDGDSGNNGKFSCSINNDNFQLIKLYHTEFKIVTSKVFNREDVASYTVPLVCRDKGEHPQTSVVNLHVNVMDENDHAPVFWPPRYSAILEENNPIGAYILKVNATDGDVGPNGKITFKLDPNAGELVKVEPNSGLITAAIIFDYERIKNFEFQVYAVDGGEPQKSATATVHMTILDHNDEPPKFSQDSYSFGTYENQEPGFEVGRVLAKDADNPPFNHFVFKLDPLNSAVDTFAIDSNSGVITTKKTLDREGQPVYYLTVIADPADGIMYSSTASVSIYVADKNDNEPVFDFPTVENNTVKVSNKAHVGYKFARLHAHDIDTGTNAKLTYGIVEGNRGNTFSVDPVTGAVAVNTDISHIHLEQFYLKVLVTDNGEPPLRDYEDLMIVVSKDVAFPVVSSPYSLEGDNLIIVLAFGLATLFVVIVIVIAIIFIIRKRNREHGNGVVSDKEMQKMIQPVVMMDDIRKSQPPAPANAYISMKEMETVKNQKNIKPDTQITRNGGSHHHMTDVQLPDDHRIIIREISPSEANLPAPEAWVQRDAGHGPAHGGLYQAAASSRSNSPQLHSGSLLDLAAVRRSSPHHHLPPGAGVTTETTSWHSLNGALEAPVCAAPVPPHTVTRRPSGAADHDSDSGRGHSSEEGAPEHPAEYTTDSSTYNGKRPVKSFMTSKNRLLPTTIHRLPQSGSQTLRSHSPTAPDPCSRQPLENGGTLRKQGKAPQKVAIHVSKSRNGGADCHVQYLPQCHSGYANADYKDFNPHRESVISGEYVQYDCVDSHV